MFEEGPKGAAAVNVREEEGGFTPEQEVEEEEEREMGKVKVYKRVVPLLSSFVRWS